MTGTKRIGFVGVGYMGHGMAANLIANGHDVTVRGNRNRAPVDDLVSKGAREARSLGQMAQDCDIIHLCLSNSRQVEGVMRGGDGLIAAARDGLIVIDTTTADPGSTIALAKELAAQGGVFVDSPLGRTPKEAAAGTLDAMVGCDAATFAKIRPVIACWAQNITHVGPTGHGHKMKLLMNFLSMGYAALYAEATVLGAAVGIPPGSLRDVISNSRLTNGFFETFMKYAVDRDPDAHKFTIENGLKDLNYLNDLASDAQVVNIMAGAARHYFTHIQAAGQGSDFVPMLVDHVGRLNGLDMQKAASQTAP